MLFNYWVFTSIYLLQVLRTEYFHRPFSIGFLLKRTWHCWWSVCNVSIRVIGRITVHYCRVIWIDGLGVWFRSISIFGIIHCSILFVYIVVYCCPSAVRLALLLCSNWSTGSLPQNLGLWQSWLFGTCSWIHNYLCNQCLSPLTLWFRITLEGEVYSIQQYVIKFVSDLRQVGGFLWVIWFPPPIKLNATI